MVYPSSLAWGHHIRGACWAFLMERRSDVVVSLAGVGDLSGLRCFVTGINWCAGEVSSPVVWLVSVDLTVLMVADSVNVGWVVCILRVALVRVFPTNSPVWVLNRSNCWEKARNLLYIHQVLG